jgi:phosphatidylinositol alpha-mannosyltransferase
MRRVYRWAGTAARRLLRRAVVVTAVSDVAASAVSSFTDPRIVPNGIDVGSFAVGPVEPGRVAFLGRDELRKGLSLLLQAWPIVRAGRSDRRLRVMGVVRETGPLGVAFLGWVDDETKRRELAAAEVFCAPHLGGESFGIVLVEAMAAGCAVVASDLAAFRAVGADAVCYTPPGDPQLLAEAVRGLLDDPDRVASLATAAGDRAARFDLAVVRAAYVDAYRDAVAAAQ